MVLHFLVFQLTKLLTSQFKSWGIQYFHSIFFLLHSTSTTQILLMMMLSIATTLCSPHIIKYTVLILKIENQQKIFKICNYYSMHF